MARMRDPEGMEVSKLMQACQLTGKQVLEIGCGFGWLTWQFAGKAHKVIGFDLDLPALQDAKANQPSKVTNISFAQSMGEHLPIAPGIFDTVVFSNSL